MTLKAWEDPAFCAERLGRDEPLGAIDPEKLNVTGSSLAAGHPFAATGGRIVAALAKLLARARLRPRADLDLRRRRPGRDRDPGAANERPLPALRQLRARQARSPAASGCRRRRRWSATSPASRWSAARCCSAPPTAAAWRSRRGRCCDSIGAEVLSEPPAGGEDGGGLAAIVFDASGIDESRRLRALYDFIGPVVRGLRPIGAAADPRLPAGAVRVAARGDRAAGAGGVHALDGQGGRQGRDRAAGPGRAGRRGGDRVDAALPALGPLGLRLRPGGADQRPRRGGAAAAAELGAAARRAASPPSPAPRAGSARRSPPCWPATAPRWSAPTCPPRARR